MQPPPFLEILEDRTLLSGLPSATGLFAPAASVPVKSFLGFSNSLLDASVPLRVEVERAAGQLDLKLLPLAEDSRAFDRDHEDGLDTDRIPGRDVRSSLLTALINDETGPEIEAVSTGPRFDSVAEPDDRQAMNVSTSNTETTGQLAALSPSAGADLPPSFETAAQTEPPVQTAASGPLTDAFLLDGWRDGVPPPQAELVPVADKDLTIIAAYLVGTPPPPNLDSAAANTPTLSLTDFIAGFQPQQSGPPPSRSAVSQATPTPLEPPQTVLESQTLVEPITPPQSHQTEAGNLPPTASDAFAGEQEAGSDDDSTSAADASSMSDGAGDGE